MRHYYINILRKITFSKVINFLKLFFSFYYSRSTGRLVHQGMPVFVSIEPTTSCNLRCPQCPSGLRQFTRDTGMLEPDLFRNTLLQLKNHLHSLTFYFQGEPYLNPDFLDMVRFAADQNIFTITSTNGHYLDHKNALATVNSGLDKLIISIDGANQQSYAKYRIGGQLQKVLDGTRAMVAQKRTQRSNTPHLVWQFVAFSHNEKEVAEIKKMAREIGVDEVKIKTAQIYDFEDGHTMLPENENLSRYHKGMNGKFSLKNKLLNHCWRMWQGCVITWDGKVVPCCFDKDASHRLGNLQKESFKDVWSSGSYTNFRKMVMNNRKSVDICTNCTEGTKVFT